MLRLPARARAFGVSTALAIASLGLTPFVPASANGSAPPTWGITAGNFDLAPGHPAQEVTAFYLARIVVHPGDDVHFTPIGGHTVTFNPIVVPGVPTFAYADPNFPVGPTGNTLSFANRPGGALLTSGDISVAGPTGFTLHIGADAAGPSAQRDTKAQNGDDGGGGTTYQYLCMFHRNMTGFITVVPAGSRLPSTDAQNQVRAQKAMQADLKRGQRALTNASQDVEDNTVAAGVGATSVQGLGSTSVARFGPATIHIKVGDRVTWINRDINNVHTVTFGPEIPDTTGIAPGFLPYGPTTISSTSDQANSGFLIYQELIDYINAGSLLSATGLVVRHQVTYTFTKAGTYPYFCALHDTIGMLGTVIVSNEDAG